MNENAIEIHDLTKKRGKFSIQDLSLTLPKGCIMGLVGENGAGKTTLIRLILGALQKDGGSIAVLGRESGGKDFRSVKENIGVVPDEIGFPYSMNAKLVGSVMRRTYKKWDEALYEKYLADMSLPASQPFKDYSRGMKMKLGIAVALSHRPQLLILDEATNGLDPVARDEAVTAFGEFTRDEGHAVLISSHIVGDLEKICDYIAFLHKGKLLLCEEKDALLEKYGVLRCPKESLAGLPEGAVAGKRESPYGVEALVRRDLLPEGMPVSNVSLEELFVFMVKGNGAAETASFEEDFFA